MKKKGFTLIELLAVIVILAIIALIATPIVLGVVEDAKKSAAKSAAYGYIDAIGKQIALTDIDSSKYTPVSTSGEYIIDATVKVNGEAPSSVNLKYTDGKIGDGVIKFKGYTVTFTGDTATVSKN